MSKNKEEKKQTEKKLRKPMPKGFEEKLRKALAYDPRKEEKEKK